MTHQRALLRAISIVGSQSKLARLIGDGITQAHVYYWLYHAQAVPPRHCPTIEHLVGGAVRCEELNSSVKWWVLRSSGATQGSTYRTATAGELPPITTPTAVPSRQCATG